MHRYLLAVGVIGSLLFAGCASDSTSPDGTSGEITSGIYLFDDGDQYRYLEIPGSRNPVVIRSRVDKDYPMLDLIADDDCFLVPARVPTRTGPERYIRLKDEGIWLETTTTGSEGAVYLSFDETDQPDQEETKYMFIIHEFEEENGKLEVAIESVQHPGYFCTNTGNVFAGNAVTLKPYGSAKDAPKMLIHQISVVAKPD